MVIGVLMLAVLGGLTIGDSRRLRRHGRGAGKGFAVMWAVGALVASIIWHFPQYALAGAAINDAGQVAGAGFPPGRAPGPGSPS